MTPLQVGQHAGLSWAWWGEWPYADCHAAQRSYRQQRIEKLVPDTLWLLEHPPVLTTGRRSVDAPEALRGPPHFDRVTTERGGLATCHEPGQLVCYLLLDAAHIGPKKLVAAVERSIIQFLAAYRVTAFARPGVPGVWVETPPDVSSYKLCKIAALGMHIEHGCTMHGLAINLTNTLEGFRYIIPCGLTDTGVISLQKLIRNAPNPSQAAPRLAQAVAESLSEFSHSS